MAGRSPFLEILEVCFHSQQQENNKRSVTLVEDFPNETMLYVGACCMNQHLLSYIKNH